MGTKRDPGAYDCYANAEPDEPLFILRGRDERAPALVEAWADASQKKGTAPEKVAEARSCAAEMRAWRAGLVDGALAPRSELTGEKLKSAIRRFTVEGTPGNPEGPNGPAENPQTACLPKSKETGRPRAEEDLDLVRPFIAAAVAWLKAVGGTEEEWLAECNLIEVYGENAAAFKRIAAGGTGAGRLAPGMRLVGEPGTNRAGTTGLLAFDGKHWRVLDIEGDPHGCKQAGPYSDETLGKMWRVIGGPS